MINKRDKKNLERKKIKDLNTNKINLSQFIKNKFQKSSINKREYFLDKLIKILYLVNIDDNKKINKDNVKNIINNKKNYSININKILGKEIANEIKINKDTFKNNINF